jgi:hypothetical protein
MPAHAAHTAEQQLPSSCHSISIRQGGPQKADRCFDTAKCAELIPAVFDGHSTRRMDALQVGKVLTVRGCTTRNAAPGTYRRVQRWATERPSLPGRSSVQYNA